MPFFAKISNLLHFKAILINMGVKRGLIRRPLRWWTFSSVKVVVNLKQFGVLVEICDSLIY